MTPDGGVAVPSSGNRNCPGPNPPVSGDRFSSYWFAGTRGADGWWLRRNRLGRFDLAAKSDLLNQRSRQLKAVRRIAEGTGFLRECGPCDQGRRRHAENREQHRRGMSRATATAAPLDYLKA